ncbi:MAG: hypothetical protein V1738_05225 [Patescibacteria group bacterium]
MTKLTDKVLDELRSKDVRPVPAWRFLLRSLAAWFGFIVLVLLGAHTVSVILFLLTDHDWTELAYFRGGRLWYVFTAIPYVWFVSLFALVVVAYLDFKKTKGGYRYQPLMVVGLVIAVSLLAGTGLYAVGLGQRADELFERRLPSYRQMAPRGFQMWNHPQEGLLVGQIERINDDGTFEMVAPGGQAWSITVEREIPEPIRQQIQVGTPVRVIGSPSDIGQFKAQVVLPWKRGGQGPKPEWHLNQRNWEAEEILTPARSTGERSMRPPVHQVAPTNQPNNQ